MRSLRGLRISKKLLTLADYLNLKYLNIYQFIDARIDLNEIFLTENVKFSQRITHFRKYTQR